MIFCLDNTWVVLQSVQFNRLDNDVVGSDADSWQNRYTQKRLNDAPPITYMYTHIHSNKAAPLRPLYVWGCAYALKQSFAWGPGKGKTTSTLESKYEGRTWREKSHFELKVTGQLSRVDRRLPDFCSTSYLCKLSYSFRVKTVIANQSNFRNQDRSTERAKPREQKLMGNQHKALCGLELTNVQVSVLLRPKERHREVTHFAEVVELNDKWTPGQRQGEPSGKETDGNIYTDHWRTVLTLTELDLHQFRHKLLRLAVSKGRPDNCCATPLLKVWVSHETVLREEKSLPNTPELEEDHKTRR